MTRAQLEHLIRASANIADDDELIIIGAARRADRAARPHVGPHRA